MSTDSDMTLSCRRCGRAFIFSKAEQEFYKGKGFTTPYHCLTCRAIRRDQTHLTCSQCGTKLENKPAMYCTACLASASLEFELETKKLKGLLDEANTKLIAAQSEKAQLLENDNAKFSAIESEKVKSLQEAEAKLSIAELENTRLDGLLQEKERKIIELTEQVKNVSLELEKALKYRAALEWLEPALNNINGKFESLQRTQDGLVEEMLRLTHKMEEGGENESLLVLLRRIFQPHYKAHAPSE